MTAQTLKGIAEETGSNLKVLSYRWSHTHGLEQAILHGDDGIYIIDLDRLTLSPRITRVARPLAAHEL